jgi:hypothetical protein
MIVHSGYDERYFAHFVHSRKNRVRDQFPKSFTVKRIGGRGGTRTPGPLLAKQVGKNTKCFGWCRLQRTPSKFPLLKCPEVVPKYSNKRSHNSIGLFDADHMGGAGDSISKLATRQDLFPCFLEHPFRCLITSILATAQHRTPCAP